MENRERAVINPNIGRDVLGYVVNTLFDEESQQTVAEMQQKIADEFGDSIWAAPPGALHITLMDWIAPLVDYGRDKDQLFAELRPSYEAALENALEGVAPIDVHFNTLKVAPDAIIMIGQDDGQMQQIRHKFLESIDLLPQTKRSPAIIHSSIIRFKNEQDLEPIIDLVAQQKLSLRFAISAFQLVRETSLPMLEYEVIKEYKLHMK